MGLPGDRPRDQSTQGWPEQEPARLCNLDYWESAVRPIHPALNQAKPRMNLLELHMLIIASGMPSEFALSEDRMPLPVDRQGQVETIASPVSVDPRLSGQRIRYAATGHLRPRTHK